MVVTKCPCLHPGDVRKLRAVDVPELHHVRDCVVFPSKGRAPHPFEMSGSDLDGDEYICIWNDELIFRENVPPYLYDDKPSGGSTLQVFSLLLDVCLDILCPYCHIILPHVL